jgi:hypothetical protein
MKLDGSYSCNVFCTIPKDSIEEPEFPGCDELYMVSNEVKGLDLKTVLYIGYTEYTHSFLKNI